MKSFLSSFESCEDKMRRASSDDNGLVWGLFVSVWVAIQTNADSSSRAGVAVLKSRRARPARPASAIKKSLLSLREKAMKHNS